MTLRLLIVASLLVNVALGMQLYQTMVDYEALRVWACDHGNGGAECGED